MSDRHTLSASQIKTLLLVASEPADASTPSVEEIEHQLMEMSGDGDASRVHLLRLAFDEATPVAELTRLKDLAKTFARDAVDNAHREAAQLLYHASVAAALVHHGTRISGRPLRKQQPTYQALATTWEGHRLGDLFRRAAAAARTP